MKNRKFLLFIVLVLAIFWCNHAYGWADYVSVEAIGKIQKLVGENLFQAILLYSILTVIGCVLLALPGVTFALVAGLLFGPVLGTLCCLMATSLGAMLAFLAGRFFLKDTIKPLAMKHGLIKKWLFDQEGQKALFVLMITRLVPLFPFNLQNFAYGVTDISFVTYSLGTFLFMLPGTAMYTLGAVGLVDAENPLLYLGVAGLLAVLVLGVSGLLKKRYLNDLEER